LIYFARPLPFSAGGPCITSFGSPRSTLIPLFKPLFKSGDCQSSATPMPGSLPRVSFLKFRRYTEVLVPNIFLPFPLSFFLEFFFHADPLTSRSERTTSASHNYSCLSRPYGSFSEVSFFPNGRGDCFFSPLPRCLSLDLCFRIFFLPLSPPSHREPQAQFRKQLISNFSFLIFAPAYRICRPKRDFPFVGGPRSQEKNLVSFCHSHLKTVMDGRRASYVRFTPLASYQGFLERRTERRWVPGNKMLFPDLLPVFSPESMVAKEPPHVPYPGLRIGRDSCRLALFVQ